MLLPEESLKLLRVILNERSIFISILNLTSFLLTLHEFYFLKSFRLISGSAQSVQRLPTCSILDRLSIECRWGQNVLPTSSRPAVLTSQPPIQQVPRSLSVGINRKGLEADYLPPSNFEFKNIPAKYVFMAYCLVKHRDKFTLPTTSVSQI